MDTVNIYRLSFVSCLVMAMPCAMAVEFNLNVLDKSMRDRIDISLLKEKGVIAPGEYFGSSIQYVDYGVRSLLLMRGYDG